MRNIVYVIAILAAVLGLCGTMQQQAYAAGHTKNTEGASAEGIRSC